MNAVLTGSDTGHFAANFQEQLVSMLTTFLRTGSDGGSVVIYLGDGGDSRLRLSVEDRKAGVDLVPNAHPDVAKRWSTF